MATKKVVPPAKAKKGTALAKWDERLAQLAGIAAKTEESVGGGGQFISTKSGQLSFDGAEIPGNKMRVVVIDHILENAAFEGRFDPDAPQSPVCFAFGRDADEMVPHDNSVDKKNDTCSGCPLNEWGSADQGRGKACKNIRRLALITEDQLEDIASAQPVFIKVPVTSGKAWAGYVKQLNSTLGRPPLAVVTEISLVPDPKTQFKMQFKLCEEIEDGDVIGDLIQLYERVSKEIDFPYQPPSEDDAKPARNAPKRKQAGKAPPPKGKPAPARKAPARKAEPEPVARGKKVSAPVGKPPRGQKY